ncbi:MAG: hypothetical protein IT529_23160 [Burkholderiales bacterium]|nr:hypothetical protein [Burkholderiales bacterium]
MIIVDRAADANMTAKEIHNVEHGRLAGTPPPAAHPMVNPDLRGHSLGWIGLGRMGHVIAELLRQAQASRIELKAEAADVSDGLA